MGPTSGPYGLPVWGPDESMVGPRWVPFVSPKCTPCGPPWPTLSGSRVGGPHGALRATHMVPTWGPDGIVGWELSGDLCFVGPTHVIKLCAYSATCAELWLIVFRCLRSGVTICGPRERRNVHNDISGTFQMAL